MNIDEQVLEFVLVVQRAIEAGWKFHDLQYGGYYPTTLKATKDGHTQLITSGSDVVDLS